MKNSILLRFFLLLVFLGIYFPTFAIFEKSKWIGPEETELSIFSNYLPVFKIECDFSTSSEGAGSIIYGANDSRLLNPNLNIFNLKNEKDSTAISIKIHGNGIVQIYRYGYHPEDNLLKPLAEFEGEIYNDGVNQLIIKSNNGITDLMLNNKKIGEINVNPYGYGGDYYAFPVLGEMKTEINNHGFEFGDIAIRHFREPSNIIHTFHGPFNKVTELKVPKRSMPELKTTISVKQGLKQAEIKATARGIYDLYINGIRVNPDYFNPGSTQYNKTHLYQSYDITKYLKEGENEIFVRLAEGWWSGGSTFQTENWNFFGDRQSFIAEGSLYYHDGSLDNFYTSPKNWQYSVDGPLIEGSFFQGEVYDAGKEDIAGRKWKSAVEIFLDSTVNTKLGSWESLKIMPSYGDFVEVTDTLPAISVSEPRQGVYVYDMGFNVAGVPKIEFKTLKEGQKVNLRYAEVLYPNLPKYKDNVGMIMTENLRSAMNNDIFISSGKAYETFSPRFTLHGYRYIEITGIDSPLPLEAVKTLALSSVHDIKAHYECSDTLVNKLWDNIIRSTKSNFISIPTDCPQRNERLGWMGDISVFASTATKIADLRNLLRQYLNTVRDCQGQDGKYPDVAPTGVGFGGLLWGSAGITVPWEYYKQYRDISILKEHYESMKKYLYYVINEYINAETNIIEQHHEWGDLGDWLSPEYEKTDKSLIWECYFIYDLDIMQNIAEILGKKEDMKFYSDLKNKRKKFFINTYIDNVKGKTIWSSFDPSKEGTEIVSQISYALPIAMDIFNDSLFVNNFLKTIERENINDDGTICPPYSLMTGFIGTAWINEALSKTGNSNYAYRLLQSTTYPSWLYPVTQGATSVWERLNSYTHEDGFGQYNNMNSFNHYSFGSVGNWLLTRSLGINRDKNGTIIISPEPDYSGEISFAKGWQDIPEGRIETKWQSDGENLIIEATLPENTHGYLSIEGEIFDLIPGETLSKTFHKRNILMESKER